MPEKLDRNFLLWILLSRITAKVLVDLQFECKWFSIKTANLEVPAVILRTKPQFDWNLFFEIFQFLEDFS